MDTKINSSTITNRIYEPSSDNYENIFNIYQDEDNFYFYNLLKKVNFPEDLDNTAYDFYRTKPKDTYQLIAYRFYKSIKLWWIVCSVNQISNPIPLPPVGTVLKILKPIYVREVLSRIASKTNEY